MVFGKTAAHRQNADNLLSSPTNQAQIGPRNGCEGAPEEKDDNFAVLFSSGLVLSERFSAPCLLVIETSQIRPRKWGEDKPKKCRQLFCCRHFFGAYSFEHAISG